MADARTRLIAELRKLASYYAEFDGNSCATDLGLPWRGGVMLREAADALAADETTQLRQVIQNEIAWLREWPITICHAPTGGDVAIVLMNPNNLEYRAGTLEAVLGRLPAPPDRSRP